MPWAWPAGWRTRLERCQQPGPDAAATRLGCRRRARRRVAHGADGAAIVGAGCRRLPGDGRRGHLGRDDRELDPLVPRARPGRNRDRELEGLRRRAPQPEAARRPVAGGCHDAPLRCRSPPPSKSLAVESVGVGAPGHTAAAGRERQLLAARRGRPGHHRAERVGKVDGGAERSSASGRTRSARSGSMAQRLTDICPSVSASTSATSRRTSSCSRARSPRTSPASIRRPRPTR